MTKTFPSIFSNRSIGFYQAVLVICVAVLVLMGLVMIFSTSGIIALAQAGSSAEANPYGEVIKQGVFAVVGAVLCFIASRIPWNVYQNRGVLFIAWAIGMFLILATAAVGAGDDEWGARRWLIIGGVSLQISEFMKIVMVLISAYILYYLREGMMDMKEMMIAGGLGVIVPLAFIVKSQSDLGTTIVCCVGILVVVWLAGTPPKAFFGIVVALIAVGVMFIVTEPYRLSRFTTFLNPWADGEGGFGAGYQLIHSWYALANGGITGTGLGMSHEKYLYLTQSETDFIFAVIGEEGGLIAAIIVIVLFLGILYAGIGIAHSLSQPAARLVVAGCVSMIVFQAFMNIAMVVGMFPIVGKPLPFVSSGGSSLVAMLLIVGIILSMSRSESDGSVYENRRKNLQVVRATGRESQSRRRS